MAGAPRLRDKRLYGARATAGPRRLLDMTSKKTVTQTTWGIGFTTLALECRARSLINDFSLGRVRSRSVRRLQNTETKTVFGRQKRRPRTLALECRAHSSINIFSLCRVHSRLVRRLQNTETKTVFGRQKRRPHARSGGRAHSLIKRFSLGRARSRLVRRLQKYRDENSVRAPKAPPARSLWRPGPLVD